MVNDALRKRLQTSAWLIPAFVAAVFVLPTAGFAAALALPTLLAAREWATLSGVQRTLPQTAFVGCIAALLSLFWLPGVAPALVLVPAVLWWLGFAATLPWLRVQAAAAGTDRLLLVLGCLVLPAVWFAMVHLHGASAQGPALVFGLVALIALADTAAYFVGSRFGRRKLVPRLSPGKTRVGLYAALAAAGAALLVAGILLDLPPGRVPVLVLLGVVTVAMSVVGDLFESWLKRRRGRKDSGTLLPGHGGMLDRIDSITAAAPIFVLGLIWMGFST